MYISTDCPLFVHHAGYPADCILHLLYPMSIRCPAVWTSNGHAWANKFLCPLGILNRTSRGCFRFIWQSYPCGYTLDGRPTDIHGQIRITGHSKQGVLKPFAVASIWISSGWTSNGRARGANSVVHIIGPGSGNSIAYKHRYALRVELQIIDRNHHV